jgi:outer membrane protein OmpA-like peptidoglycan-associated protein
MKRVIAAVLLAGAGTASADRWMSAELPTAVAVSDVQEQVFRPGAMPAVGGYVQLSTHFAVGVRARAGVLRDRLKAPILSDANRMEPATGGLATAGLAARVMFGGVYVELVAGGGITGSDVVPTFEAGAGYMFDFEHISVGPSARYARVQASGSDALGSADLVLVGVDFQFGHEHHRELVPHYVRTEPPPPAAPMIEKEPFEYDNERVVDALASCADLLEYLADDSGCGNGSVEVAGDRIILDDRVLFETDHAHVHAEGRAMIRSIAKAAAQHPEWTMLTIEGHADVRGSDEWNQTLSQLRADAVRAQMVKAGFPAEKIKTIGYGRSHPRDPGTSPAALQHNRRVEFVIDRAPQTVGAEQ